MGDFNSHIRNNPDIISQYEESDTNEIIGNLMSQQMSIVNELEKMKCRSQE